MFRRLASALRRALGRDEPTISINFLTPGHGKLMRAAHESEPNRLAGDPDAS